MAKFSGKIGFSITNETSPGVWTDAIVEKHYYGDLIKRYSRWDPSQYLHDDLVFSEDISVLADPYFNANKQNMIYVDIRGTKWKIKSFDDTNYPRVTISTGGEWHGNAPTTSN